MSDRVKIDFKDGVADVRMTRADKMNAIDSEMFDGLVQAGRALPQQIGITRKLSQHWSIQAAILAEQEEIKQEDVTRRYNFVGLPIVLKIFEDHHGGLELLDGLERPDGGRGAEVVMTLPLRTTSFVTQAAS